MKHIFLVVATYLIASTAHASGIINDVPISMQVTSDMVRTRLIAAHNWKLMYVRIPAAFHGWGTSRASPYAALDDAMSTSAKQVRLTRERCGDAWGDLPPCPAALFVFVPTPKRGLRQQVGIPPR